MSGENPSTIQSYIDSATGMVQNALGTGGGSADSETQNTSKQNKESGTKSVDKGNDPDRSAGSWNQTIGAAKEAVGGAVGSQPLKQAGRDQNLSGQQQEARGQVKDYATGVAGQVTGRLGNAAAALGGDRTKQEEYQKQHDAGKTKQRGAEEDILKEAEAADRSNQNGGKKTSG